MPTYEYRCAACEEITEAVQAFTDDPLTTCESCGGELRKLFRGVGVVFKGSGFYRTDSRSSGTSGSAADSSASSASNSTPVSPSGASPSSGAASSSPAAKPSASSGGGTTASP